MGSDMSKANSGKIGQDPDFINDYKKVSKKYPDVKNVEHKLEAGIERIIDAVENGGAQDSLPLESLKVLTSWLAEKDEHLRNLILKNKKDIWKDNKLLELIELYFELNAVTSKFYNALNNCLVRVKDKQILLEIALECIGPANSPPSNAQYTLCKDKLQEFKAAENPFNEEFFNLLKSVRQQHEEIVEKVKGQKKKLDRKFKRVRAWRKISNVIFASAFATVVICSVLAAVMAAPPFVLAVAAIPLIPIATTGNFINSPLTKYENTIKIKREVVDTIRKVNYGGLWELNQISACVERLEDTIVSILRAVDIYCRDEVNQRVALNGILERQKRFKDQTATLTGAVDGHQEETTELSESR